MWNSSPSTVITALLGDKTLTGLRLKSHDGVESELKVDGLFIAIGLVPENTAFADVADINEYGYFDSDESCLTHTPGVFAAGVAQQADKADNHRRCGRFGSRPRSLPDISTICKTSTGALIAPVNLIYF